MPPRRQLVSDDESSASDAEHENKSRAKSPLIPTDGSSDADERDTATGSESDGNSGSDSASDDERAQDLQEPSDVDVNEPVAFSFTQLVDGSASQTQAVRNAAVPMSKQEMLNMFVGDMPEDLATPEYEVRVIQGIQFSFQPASQIDEDLLADKAFFQPLGRCLPFRDDAGRINVHFLKSCAKSIESGKLYLKVNMHVVEQCRFLLSLIDPDRSNLTIGKFQPQFLRGKSSRELEEEAKANRGKGKKKKNSGVKARSKKYSGSGRRNRGNRRRDDGVASSDSDEAEKSADGSTGPRRSRGGRRPSSMRFDDEEEDDDDFEREMQRKRRAETRMEKEEKRIYWETMRRKCETTVQEFMNAECCVRKTMSLTDITSKLQRNIVKLKEKDAKRRDEVDSFQPVASKDVVQEIVFEDDLLGTNEDIHIEKPRKAVLPKKNVLLDSEEEDNSVAVTGISVQSLGAVPAVGDQLTSLKRASPTEIDLDVQEAPAKKRKVSHVRRADNSDSFVTTDEEEQGEELEEVQKRVFKSQTLSRTQSQNIDDLSSVILSVATLNSQASVEGSFVARSVSQPWPVSQSARGPSPIPTPQASSGFTFKIFGSQTSQSSVGSQPMGRSKSFLNKDVPVDILRSTSQSQPKYFVFGKESNSLHGPEKEKENSMAERVAPLFTKTKSAPLAHKSTLLSALKGKPKKA